MNEKDNKPKRGPKPEELKVVGADWEDAMAHALHKRNSKGSKLKLKPSTRESAAKDG